MTIEKLEPLARRPHWVAIHFSDGTTLKTQDYVAAEQGLFTGQELSEAAYQALLEAVGRASAKARAVRMISAAGHSRRELERRLVQKGENAADAQAAVDWLSDLKLLDDARTAQELVRSAVAKGYGKARIRQILYEKSIPKEYWDQALALVPEMDEAVDRFGAALRRHRAGGKGDQAGRGRAAAPGPQLSGYPRGLAALQPVPGRGLRRLSACGNAPTL